ncbi:chain-length determining protein [Geomonas terrae]|uniref:Chain-length determining protein n=1 Tax=Geomonas terrae TaxID=2562681 RepID=A0A4S1CH48_9BACT|nr:XrtA system polysaccharide chain length determinant [Geomonas terrae]TGU70469.1 chain-length determining protein [Geomonas terrae]TGU72889.1 chain-length determining protein [Geomonas terrae]
MQESEYKKYVQLVTRHKERFVLWALLIMTLVFLVSYLLPRKYESSSTVFIEKNVISELVKGITVTPSMDDTINVLTYAITSRSLLTKAMESLDMNLGKEGNDELIRDLQKNITVKVKEKNNLFIISFAYSDPRISRDFVNTLVRLYIEQNTSSKRGESYDATKFLAEQIQTFNTKLEKSEGEVNAYKREKGGIISIDEGKLFEEINTAQQKLYDLQLRRRQLEGMRQVTRRANDPLQSRLIALQKRLEELRVQYTDSYPEVLTVKGDIETVQEQLKARKGGEPQPLDPQEVAKIDSEVAALKVVEEGLNRHIQKNREVLQSIPGAKAGLAKLEVERENQKKLYDELYARHGQSEVSKQMEVQDKSTTFRIVDPAVLPVKPSSPNRIMIMLAGIFGGLAGSLGLLVLRDQFDGSVKELSFVKALGVPVLAVVPRMVDAQQAITMRRRTHRIIAVAAVYFLLLLVFPVMELLQLPYMDRLLDHLTPISQGLWGMLH